jgi:hypothetical protein
LKAREARETVFEASKCKKEEVGLRRLAQRGTDKGFGPYTEVLISLPCTEYRRTAQRGDVIGGSKRFNIKDEDDPTRYCVFAAETLSAI